MIDLSGKVAIVTGSGSERGIGQAIAMMLAKHGATLIVADLVLEGASKVVKSIENAGGTAHPVQMDVTSEASIIEAYKKVVKLAGKIDILVNNAGITQPVKVADMTLADWNKIFTVNATGTFLCSKYVVPYMEKNGFGRIINISSVSAKQGGGVFGGAHYCGAKAAVCGFGKALAKEVATKNITVNSVLPGIVLTDIRGGVESETEQKTLSANIPVQRMGRPDDVAAAVCYLASEEASYITGEDLDVNGGSHID